MVGGINTASPDRFHNLTYAGSKEEGSPERTRYPAGIFPGEVDI
jgi:hypothetical protein